MNAWANIRTIAKREIGGYFASPVAYVFIVIFLLLCGFFTFMLGGFFERREASPGTQTATPPKSHCEGHGTRGGVPYQKSKRCRISPSRNSFADGMKTAWPAPTKRSSTTRRTWRHGLCWSVWACGVKPTCRRASGSKDGGQMNISTPCFARTGSGIVLTHQILCNRHRILLQNPGDDRTSDFRWNCDRARQRLIQVFRERSAERGQPCPRV